MAEGNPIKYSDLVIDDGAIEPGKRIGETRKAIGKANQGQ